MSQQRPLGRAVGGIDDRFVGEFYIRRGQRPAVVKLDVFAEIELKSALAEPLPALGQFGLQLHLLVGAQQRIINQMADAHGVGVGGITRIELRRIGFDTENEVIGPAFLTGPAATSGKANQHEHRAGAIKVARQGESRTNFD